MIVAAPFILKVAGLLAYAAVEYWLGKTDKVKAGSVLEVILNVGKLILGGTK